MTAQLRRDLVAAAVAVVVAGVFWTQRDYRERLSGVFPDFVLTGLAVLAALLVVRVLVARFTGKAADGEELREVGVGEESDSGPGGSLAMVLASMAFLAAWVALLSPLGFTLSGIFAFLAITIFVRRGSLRLRHLLVDIPVAVAVVWLCFLIFTRVLLVPLPVPPFIYG